MKFGFGGGDSCELGLQAVFAFCYILATIEKIYPIRPFRDPYFGPEAETGNCRIYPARTILQYAFHQQSMRCLFENRLAVRILGLHKNCQT